MAVMRIVLAFGLCLTLTTTAGWGQTPDQSPSGWFRVSMEPTIGQLVVDAVLIVAVAIVLGWVDAGRRPDVLRHHRALTCGRTKPVAAKPTRDRQRPILGRKTA